jgi:hypothetical protein
MSSQLNVNRRIDVEAVTAELALTPPSQEVSTNLDHSPSVGESGETYPRNAHEAEIDRVFREYFADSGSSSDEGEAVAFDFHAFDQQLADTEESLLLARHYGDLIAPGVEYQANPVARTGELLFPGENLQVVTLDDGSQIHVVHLTLDDILGDDEDLDPNPEAPIAELCPFQHFPTSQYQRYVGDVVDGVPVAPPLVDPPINMFRRCLYDLQCDQFHPVCVQYAATRALADETALRQYDYEHWQYHQNAAMMFRIQIRYFSSFVIGLALFLHFSIPR